MTESTFDRLMQEYDRQQAAKNTSVRLNYAYADGERPIYSCNEYAECGCGKSEHCMYCLKPKKEHA